MPRLVLKHFILFISPCAASSYGNFLHMHVLLKRTLHFFLFRRVPACNICWFFSLSLHSHPQKNKNTEAPQSTWVENKPIASSDFSPRRRGHRGLGWSPGVNPTTSSVEGGTAMSTHYLLQSCGLITTHCAWLRFPLGGPLLVG